MILEDLAPRVTHSPTKWAQSTQIDATNASPVTHALTHSHSLSRSCRRNMAKEATTQVPSPKQYLGKYDESQTAVASGGWSSFLTWRKPRNAVSIASTNAATPKNRAPRHGYSPTSGQHSSISRPRAPIPFELGPRRTASSSSTASSSHDLFQEDGGSTSVMEVERGLAAAYDDEEDEIRALDTAFASLSRVRRKADDAQGSLHGNPSSPHPSRSTLAPVSSFSPEPASNGSWLAWGSSTIRSTLPRGMVSSLFPSDSSPEVAKLGLASSPVNLASTFNILSSEKWKPAERDEVDRYVDRMIGFAGIDGQ